MTWALLGLYLCIQLGIGYYVSKRVHSDTDYYLAGRHLSLPVVSISVFATWFGAETCIGSSAAVFSEGLSGGRADPFGYSLCLLLAGWFLASQLWKRQITTLGDFFRSRYNAPVEKLSAIIMTPSSLIWSAAQIKAFGHILSVLTQTDPTITTLIATAIVLTYTSMGGLLADVFTDLLQGGILAIGLIVLLILSIQNIGSLDLAWQNLDKSRLSLIAEGATVWEQLDTWMIPILGSLVAQEMISRALSARSARVARSGTMLSAVIYIFFGSIPVLLGLFGNQIISGDLPHDDQFLPVLAQTLLPHGLFLIFSAAIVSAILSTIDSSLLAVSAFTTHNIFGEAYRKCTPRKQVFIAKATVVAGGLVAYVIATHGGSIYDLVETASAFGAAGVLTCTLGGLYLKTFSGPWTAAATLLVGVSAHPVYELILQIEAPFVATLATAVGTFILIGVLERALLGTSKPLPNT